MKSITSMALICALTFATSASSDESKPSQDDPFLSTAGPAANLTAGLITAAAAITIIGIAAFSDSSSSSGTD